MRSTLISENTYRAVVPCVPRCSYWNALPQHVIEAPMLHQSIQLFKNRSDKYWSVWASKAQATRSSSSSIKYQVIREREFPVALTDTISSLLPSTYAAKFFCIAKYRKHSELVQFVGIVNVYVFCFCNIFYLLTRVFRRLFSLFTVHRARAWVSKPVTCFYRAMHFSAKRGIAIACRLSVRLSVCLSVCL